MGRNCDAKSPEIRINHRRLFQKDLHSTSHKLAVLSLMVLTVLSLLGSISSLVLTILSS